MANEVYYKKPADIIFVPIDFADYLRSTDTALVALASGVTEVTAVDSAGTDKTSTVIVSPAVVNSLVLEAQLKAGVNGEDYLVTFLATGNVSADIATRQVELRVRETR